VNANFAAVEAHAKGLRRVFDLFGGLERADHMFLSKIYLYAPRNTPFAMFSIILTALAEATSKPQP
jgi:hypothetical protein